MNIQSLGQMSMSGRSASAFTFFDLEAPQLGGRINVWVRSMASCVPAAAARQCAAVQAVAVSAATWTLAQLLTSHNTVGIGHVHERKLPQ